MSEAHESFIATILKGVRSRGSGNKPANPSDGRQDHHIESIAFSWDCKATLKESISVSLKMWEKIKEQSHGERPCIPIRFYQNDRLTEWQDLIILNLDDFIELTDEIEKGDEALQNLFDTSKRLLNEKTVFTQKLLDGNAQLLQEIENLQRFNDVLLSFLPEPGPALAPEFSDIQNRIEAIDNGKTIDWPDLRLDIFNDASFGLTGNE